MGTAESSRGRRERSPKQEFLDQVLKCVLMRGGRGGLYRRGGASGSTNLDVVKSFNERQLLVNSQPLVTSNGQGVILQSLLSTFILCFNALNSKTFFSAHGTAPSRPRHAHGLGEASERARVWFTDLLLPASQVVYTKSTL